MGCTTEDGCDRPARVDSGSSPAPSARTLEALGGARGTWSRFNLNGPLRRAVHICELPVCARSGSQLARGLIEPLPRALDRLICLRDTEAQLDSAQRNAEAITNSARSEADERLKRAAQQAQEQQDAAADEAQRVRETAAKEAAEVREAAQNEARQLRDAAETRVRELEADAQSIAGERTRLINGLRELTRGLDGYLDGVEGRFRDSEPEQPKAQDET